MIAWQINQSPARQIATVAAMNNVFLADASPQPPLVSNVAAPGGTTANAASMATTTAPSTQSASQNASSDLAMANAEAMLPMHAEQNPFPVSSGALNASRLANVNPMATTTAVRILNVCHAAPPATQMANAANTGPMPAQGNHKKY